MACRAVCGAACGEIKNSKMGSAVEGQLKPEFSVNVTCLVSHMCVSDYKQLAYVTQHEMSISK